MNKVDTAVYFPHFAGWHAQASSEGSSRRTIVTSGSNNPALTGETGFCQVSANYLKVVGAKERL
jgi:hypothetical protein